MTLAGVYGNANVGISNDKEVRNLLAERLRFPDQR